MREAINIREVVLDLCRLANVDPTAITAIVITPDTLSFKINGEDVIFSATTKREIRI